MGDDDLHQRALQLVVRGGASIGAPQGHPSAAINTPAQGTSMRAATASERLQDMVRNFYESAAKQPVARVLDLLGLTDLSGVANEMGGARTALKMGVMSEGPKRVSNPIKAYHGSPHDFDQFSLSKIGTGEGAQAYGHGLYFADNENVAKAYRDNLQDKNLTNAEKLANVAANAVGRLDDGSVLFKGRMWSPEQWLNAFQDGKLTGHDFGPQARSAMEDALKGRMYEVNIHADPEHMLDWDKPLSQQSEHVQKAMSRYVTPNEYGRVTDKRVGSGSGAYQEVVAMRERLRQQGRDLVGGREGASQALQEAGIPGIKYLDQASRVPQSQLDAMQTALARAEARGDAAVADNLRKQIQAPRTRNYVVFDDQRIEIVKKYGIAGALAAGLINESQARQLQAQGAK